MGGVRRLVLVSIGLAVIAAAVCVVWSRGPRRSLRTANPTVDVVVMGGASVIQIPPVYNERYVLQATDYGYLWLDSEALIAGHVQVTSKCGLGQPPPVTNIYVVGDCNGTGNVTTSSNRVMVRLTNSQCGTTKGCNGSPVNAFQFFFELGTWTFLGYNTEPVIPDSTQKTDTQGRTWTAQAVAPFDGQHFQWSVASSGGVPVPTSPPIPTVAPTQVPTFAPVLTPTPCSDAGSPFGVPGPFGWCYGCDGTVKGQIKLNGTCGPLDTVSPTATKTPRPVPTATQTLVPTPTVTRTPVPSSTDLTLNNNRFRITVHWKSNGTEGPGQAVEITSDTGYFWFFSANNVELVIKVLDGRALGGYWWVFYGALSDVEYDITVTDTMTGAVKKYHNPQGTLASVADTTAFKDSP